MKNRVVLLGVILFVSVLAGLSAAPKKEAPVAAAGGATFVFTDSAGRNITLPAPIRRVAPSGSMAQMYLLAIAPDLFCAVTASIQGGEAEFLPVSLASLPAVGQFYGQANLNPEEIARIAPDIIIDVGEAKDTIAKDMDDISAMTAIPVVHITADLRGAAQAYRMLGKLLDRQEKGEALARYCEKVLAQAQRIVDRAGANKKSVLYCMGNTGMNVLAKNSYHSEILDWMTNNKAVVDNPSSRGSGNESNLEQLFLWDPEVIFFGPGSIYASVSNDPAWKQLQAIRNGRYYEVPQGPYNWMGSPPSINRYLGILWMGKILYPEYADYDLYTETAEYYKLFYGYELSRERFDRLTSRSK